MDKFACGFSIGVVFMALTTLFSGPYDSSRADNKQLRILHLYNQLDIISDEQMRELSKDGIITVGEYNKVIETIDKDKS